MVDQMFFCFTRKQLTSAHCAIALPPLALPPLVVFPK